MELEQDIDRKRHEDQGVQVVDGAVPIHASPIAPCRTDGLPGLGEVLRVQRGARKDEDNDRGGETSQAERQDVMRSP